MCVCSLGPFIALLPRVRSGALYGAFQRGAVQCIYILPGLDELHRVIPNPHENVGNEHNPTDDRCDDSYPDLTVQAIGRQSTPK